MNKTLLMVMAFIAPVMSQDAPDGFRPIKPQGHLNNVGRIFLSQKMVMDKYDVNKDGKLDAAEKAALKVEADKIDEARHKANRAKWDKDGDGKLSDEEKAAMKAEHDRKMSARKARMEDLKGKEGEAKSDGEKKEQGSKGGKGKRGPEAPRGERPAFDMILVGQALLMEKYDTNKDGKFSKEEHIAMMPDMKAARDEALKDAKPEDVPAPEEE